MNILICTIKTWNLELSREFTAVSQHNVKVISNKEDLNLKLLMEFNPQYIFFPHWSWIIPKDIYERYTCIVFHMTDLPFGRGGSPLQNLIARGETRTKISAIQVTKDLDAGPVFLKEPLDLFGSAEEIFIRSARIVFQIMIPAILEKECEPTPQTGEPFIFSRRKPEDGRITETMSLNQIYDYIRMLDAEGYPNAFIRFGRYKLCFSRAAYGYNKLRCDVEIVEEKDE